MNPIFESLELYVFSIAYEKICYLFIATALDHTDINLLEEVIRDHRNQNH